MQINLSSKSLKYRKTYVTPFGEEKTHNYIGIIMMDDKGQRIGMGECAPLPWASADKDAYVRMSDAAELINKALASDDYAEYLRPYPALLFALESAMYDYQHSEMLYDTDFAKSLVGIPVVGDVAPGTYEEMFAEAKKQMLQGFRCLKLHAGQTEWNDILKTLEKLRSRFSPQALQIRIDAHGSFAIEEAEEKMRQLAECGVQMVQQPLKQYQWKEMAELCTKNILPVVLHEELIGVHTVEEKAALLDTIRPQYIAVSPTLHGGMAGTIEWISEAQKRGIGSWLASAHEGNIGLRNVALLAARIYDMKNVLPQDIETGRLYSDNIEMDIEQRHNKLWRCEVDE